MILVSRTDDRCENAKMALGEVRIALGMMYIVDLYKTNCNAQNGRHDHVSGSTPIVQRLTQVLRFRAACHHVTQLQLSDNRQILNRNNY